MSYGGYQPYGQPPPPQGGYYQPPPPSQGQYGYQQPGQYGAPPPAPAQGQQGQYYPPPPSQMYGQSSFGPPPPVGPRPQELYGSAPPPQNYQQYNQSGFAQNQYPPPPQHGFYNQPVYASPGSPYGRVPAVEPPAGLSPGYGAPPPPKMAGFNAGPYADQARRAMKGLGTDEKMLIDALADKDPYEIEAIKEAFQRNHGRNLYNDVEKEASGKLEDGLLAILRGPLHQDAYLLHKAIDRPGTKESVLNDVLLGRSNADMNAIKAAFRQDYHRDLTAAVKGDLSLKTERHFELVLSAARREPAAPVLPDAVSRDVDALYDATEGRLGTDEMKVCSILSTRTDAQIRAAAAEYRRRYARDLEDVIRREFRGHMEDALLYQLRRALDPHAHQARLLEDAMAGAGTRDQLLISRVVAAHWDQDNMERVKAAYQRLYGRSLAARIKGETSGDYERLMLACIGA